MRISGMGAISSISYSLFPSLQVSMEDLVQRECEIEELCVNRPKLVQSDPMRIAVDD